MKPPSCPVSEFFLCLFYIIMVPMRWMGRGVSAIGEYMTAWKQNRR